MLSFPLYSPHSAPNDSRYRASPWYYQTKSNFTKYQADMKEICIEEGIPWDSRLDAYFERVLDLEGILRHETMWLALKRRLAVIEDKVNHLLKYDHTKKVVRLSLTSATATYVEFSDGEIIWFDLDFALRHKRVRVKRTTEKDLAQTLALNPIIRDDPEGYE